MSKKILRLTNPLADYEIMMVEHNFKSTPIIDYFDEIINCHGKLIWQKKKNEKGRYVAMSTL